MKQTSKRPHKPRRHALFPGISERLLPFMLKLNKWLIRTAVVMAAALALCLSLFLYVRSQPLPAAAISQTSQMLDLHGNVIDTFHAGENRRSVPLDDISRDLIHATLSIEDRRFYEHYGFDLRGLARAVVVNVQNMSARQGASTLTQQLARNLYLSHEKTWQRKLKEAMYTAKLEMDYTKDDILSMYLNQIYYGHGSYGIEAASMLYFDKHASELTLAESAMLAGIPKGPKYYSPYMDMKNAKDRQYLILESMTEGGFITKEQAENAYREVLDLKPLDSGEPEGFAPYFRDYIRQLALDEIGIQPSVLNKGGITIYTTLDQNIQNAAEDAIKNGIPGDSGQQAALVAIDPRNGYVKAMVGGRDYRTNQYNRVFARTRQPGSAFKPLLYLTALRSRYMTPVTQFRSEPTVFSYDEGRKSYEPRNYGDKYANDLIDMRRAISSSDNIYAVNTLMTIGVDKVIQTSKDLGISSPLDPVPSLALGSSPISPFEMASAYSVFASGGFRVEPIAILRIEDRKGKVLYEAKPVMNQPISPAEAYVMTSLLEGVFEQGGTANRVSSIIKRPVAGKTGTTDYDAWLVGYTPELSAAVWVGHDKNKKLTLAEAHRAAPIFASFMEGALSAVPPKMFAVPEGVSTVYIEPSTGRLAAASCGERRLETFLSGTEPTEICGTSDNLDGHGEGNVMEQQTRSNEKTRKKKAWWHEFKKWWSD